MNLAISLALYQDQYKEALFRFYLPEEQEQFTGMPADTLEEALADENRMAVVILEGERPVGFFILHGGDGISDFYPNPFGALLLRAFLIDYAHQGKGYAKTALLLLPQFVRMHFPTVREVVLAVNERNLPAERLYSQAGFVDHGMRRTGERGLQKILQYDLHSYPALENPGEGEGLKQRLIDIITGSPWLMNLFHGAQALEPYPYYIGAGCLVQTVWNELTGRPLHYGIEDIDIVYYDSTDLSFESEDAMILKAKTLFADIPIPLDLKNQARVHLWYRDKFGIDLQPYISLEASLDTWPTTATCLGARMNKEGSWKIYAPYGLEDLFALTIRPNKVLINETIYLSKAQKWVNKWPELQIVPW
ncbi:nucleotidyltransferase family protein [Paenibacillus sp. NPDC056722]|uniref:nucleotidyltransferase family protein n=1 Tax=Paenibacillus sp. NPDC056722 TaxID=3345924 RepID=UPI00369A0E42